MLAFYNKHMAFTRITNVAVKGVAACVPKRIEYNKDFKGLSEEQLQKYIETVGVVERHCAVHDGSLCTSDLCYEAAEKLILELGWNREDVGLLIVSFRIDWDYPKKLWHLMSLWVVLVLSMVWA